MKTGAKYILKFWLVIGIFMGYTSQINAQYFGKNKPGYDVFDFEVYQTPNFEIYHYFADDSLMREMAESAEQWYQMHYNVFQDSITFRNPLIFYQDHADFQQTNTTMGSVSVGTGGFTEGLKNRVVMPMAITRGQTDHVLGHELVHAFQYDIFTGNSSDSLSLRNMQNIPLWMIEGMAEYLSIGSIDPHTAMWMRDAVLTDDFPSLDDLTKDPSYFPYRYGQAFWAFTARMWGDSIIKPLLVETAKFGYDRALRKVVGYDAKTVSNMWKMATLTHFKDILKDTDKQPVGKNILNEENAGEMNISPSISPDGKYVAFLSEKDVFTIDLFLANAETGEIIKKLSSTVHNSEIDAFNFLESSGTWSPDGKKFAFVVFTKGKNKLAIVDVDKAKITEEIEIPFIESFTNPAWSPDGDKIVVAGMKHGYGNLYTYNFKTNETQQLTNDIYTAFQPSWSNDGKSIVYVTDIKKTEVPDKQKYNYNLAILDTETSAVNILDVFEGADNLNPLFSADGSSVFFLSDRDGFRNLYRYDLAAGDVLQLTSYATGISGISELSPALSLANNDKLVYSYYTDGDYTIYQAMPEEFTPVKVDADDVSYYAATLPPYKPMASVFIDNQLADRPEVNLQETENDFKEIPYRPKFKLDYISNSGVGFGTSRFGTAMAGSVSAIFSDIIGDNQIYASLSLNGEIYDFGGSVAYFNQKRRLNWGGAVSHVPYRFGYYTPMVDTITINDEEVETVNYALDIYRLFETRASLFTFFPISTTRRIEAGIAGAHYGYRIDRFNNYYEAGSGFPLGGSREKLDAPPGFNLFQTDLAYVFDNSHFGITAPMQGRRSRISVEKNFGYYDHVSTLVDYRKYIFMNPVSLAFRGYGYGRWGGSGDVLLNNLYLGYPWLVRGYDNITDYAGDDGGAITIDDLVGSRMVVSNVELRIPFTGPKKLSLIGSKYLFSDLALFFDAGLAWDSGITPEIKWEKENINDRIPVFSTGISLRVNLFGYMILEPYYAFPLQVPDAGGVFGINFTPGW
jgi:Tol biopolymer transport system component